MTKAQGFRDKILSIPNFTSTAQWQDKDVWDTDLMDPDVAPNTGDDTNQFDPVTAAISFFSGHGSCSDQKSTSCTTTASCPNITGLVKKSALVS
jgi:hypothetical protein